MLRLNQKRLHPTPHVVFIKPLPDRPDTAVAEEFLNRVAAICHPILKDHHLKVTSLEEFPPNREFVGRNFNNGECIQLVLRTQQRSGGRGSSSTSSSSSSDNTGGWLPFRAVVMVMMHELAHNVQMNHSRAFWAVRNAYAAEMRALWGRGYTGEGMWGPGRQLSTGLRVPGGRELDPTEMPEHLCGGTYRRRRRNGKRKPKLSRKEQQERRIARKFGTSADRLGEDVVERLALQGFKGPTTKSRVAGSKRARELRAAAALSRFEKDKSKKASQDEDDGIQTDGEGQGEQSSDEYDDPDDKVEDALDFDGSRMQDENGRGLIRVCEDEDGSDVHVKEEMDELQALNDIPWHEESHQGEESGTVIKSEPGHSYTQDQASGQASSDKLNSSRSTGHNITASDARSNAPAPRIKDPKRPTGTKNAPAATLEVYCAVCSMANDSGALLCLACSNVLDPTKSPGSWKCGSDTCRESQYLNPSDYGVCGICGAKKGG